MKLTLVCLLIAAFVGASLAEGETEKPQLTLKERFNKLVDDLKHIGKTALANAAQQALAAGKATLIELLLKLEMEHITSGIGKRSLKDDLLAEGAEALKKIEHAISENAAKATHAYENAMDKLKAVIARIHESDMYNNAEEKVHEIKAEINKVLKEHNIVLREVADDLTRKGKVGQKIADFFKPHIEKVKGHINNIGDLAKEHATNVHEAAKAHINDLAGKMLEHGKTLVGHGQKAVDQLKEAVTDILNETFKNMAGTIKDAIETGKDSINTITDHVNNAAQA